MSNILDDSDVVKCLFDSDIEVSDLPSDNNSFVDDSDADPDFFVDLTTSKLSKFKNHVTIMSSSTSSSSDSEYEEPINVRPAKKRTYSNRKKRYLKDTSTSQNLPDSHDTSSIVLPTHSVDHPFIEPQWDKDNEMFTNPVFLSDSNLAPHILMMENKSPYNIFLEMFPDSLIDTILFQTNLYAQQSQKPYTPATKQELKTFLGVNILMGLKRQSSYRDYWSSSPDLNDPYICKQMTVNRFGWFLSNIHCNDSMLEPKRGSPNFDKLYKLRPVIEKLGECFQKSKNLTQVLSIDESMVKFKGRSTLKQFMPQKPIKRGYKIWMLNDKTKYTYIKISSIHWKSSRWG